jgi:hypothetical protein
MKANLDYSSRITTPMDGESGVAPSFGMFLMPPSVIPSEAVFQREGSRAHLLPRERGGRVSRPTSALTMVLLLFRPKIDIVAQQSRTELSGRQQGAVTCFFYSGYDAKQRCLGKWISLARSAIGKRFIAPSNRNAGSLCFSFRSFRSGKAMWFVAIYAA